MSEYTKGPWFFEDSGRDGLTIYGKTSDGDTIVICSRRFHPYREEEMKANFTLLNAAPDLLDALVDCRRALEIANFSQELSVVDAAIAKATPHQQSNRSDA
jgi:hypothetical protein